MDELLQSGSTVPACDVVQSPPSPQTSVPAQVPLHCTPIIPENWNADPPLRSVLLLQCFSHCGRWEWCKSCSPPPPAFPVEAGSCWDRQGRASLTSASVTGGGCGLSLLWLCLAQGCPRGEGSWHCPAVTGRSCFLQTSVLHPGAVCFALA